MIRLPIRRQTLLPLMQFQRVRGELLRYYQQLLEQMNGEIRPIV
jgi:hypothetical protein